MNVKQFADMVKPIDSPLKILLCAGAKKGYETISEYDRENPYHQAAFGAWKVRNITAPYENCFELVIETRIEIVQDKQAT